MSVKNKTRFAEIEKISGDYFSCHLAPIMSKVQGELSERQAKEMRDYSSSAAGVLSFIANANMPGGDPYATLKTTGEWNSKTAEDYLTMCKTRILADKSIQQDLALMAEQWRNAVVSKIGRTRYDELSQQLGCDLAYAYIDHRIEQLMIDKLVRDKMPKSAADYIIRKAAQSSLFGLNAELSKSPLAAEIERRGEAAYKPSKAERAAGRIVGAGMDAMSFGGAGSWASLAKFVGIDVVLGAGMDKISRKGTKQAVTVEDCISKGVFGSDRNVFTAFRKEAAGIRNADDSYIMTTNGRLRKEIPTMKTNFMDWTKSNPTIPWLNTSVAEAKKREERYKEVPLVIAPGQEEVYLEGKTKWDAEEAKKQQDEAESDETKSNENQSAGGQSSPQDMEQGEDNREQPSQTNENGWGGLLANFGLDGFTDTGKNLGYVLAMLPDILVGLFTGKTKSLNLKNSTVPLASIVAGIFAKNPILKTLLIGLGGANLINKAGHEVLEARKEEGKVKLPNTSVRYRQYADEPLNPRISSPMLRGRCLIADIDNVPCTIQLPDSVVGAYQVGALPLNTLANAVLAKSEQTRQTAARNYDMNENVTERNERIEIRR